MISISFKYLNLDYKFENATDPFFGASAEAKRRVQRMGGTKIEFKLYFPNEKKYLPVGSFNFVGNLYHNRFNIKLFVINNGGYVSMHNWADSFFKGRRLDTAKDTGDGTLNLKNVAKAFDLEHFLIKDVKNVERDLKKILTNKKPLFIEVITNPRQKIFDAFKDK